MIEMLFEDLEDHEDRARFYADWDDEPRFRLPGRIQDEATLDEEVD